MVVYSLSAKAAADIDGIYECTILQFCANLCRVNRVCRHAHRIAVAFDRIVDAEMGSADGLEPLTRTRIV